MSNAKLPWAVDDQGDIYSTDPKEIGDIVCLQPGDVYEISKLKWPANRHLIVTACNNHAALVEALQSARELLRSFEDNHGMNAEAAIYQIDAALRAAGVTP